MCLAVLGGVSEVRAQSGTTVGAGGIIVGGDPTPLTPPFCSYHLYPTNQPVVPCADGCCAIASNPMGHLVGSSWAAQSPAWVKDRRPLVMIQMASADYQHNPRAQVDWWWIQTDNDPALLQADACAYAGGNWSCDNWTPLPVEAGIGWTDFPFPRVQAPNGVPDAFDALIRRIKVYAQVHGFRRFALHLPAGVLGVRFSELGIANPVTGAQYPKYEAGTTQSINQYQGMPQWKREYFTGWTYIANDLVVRNAWGQFVDEFVADNPDDPAQANKYSMEVYIGGELSRESCTLATQTTHAVPEEGEPASTWYDGVPELVASFKEWRLQAPPDAFEPVFTELWTEPRQPVGTPYAIDPRIPQHMQTLWAHINPWIIAGFKTIWLDATASNTLTDARRWGVLELAHNPYLRQMNVRIGGENIPTLDVNALQLDDCALATTRWLANSQSIIDWQGTSACELAPFRYPKASFFFNPGAHEAHFLHASCGGPLNWDEQQDIRRNGFVWSAYGGDLPSIEQVKRWYSMGKIRVADFDGDGQLTSADHALAYSVTHVSQQPSIVVFATGDIDDNGVVDTADWTAWEALFTENSFYIHNYEGPDVP
ncbi:MAG: hypothetical protein SFZ23_04745 [Planctomycetota bacterium]|nr:hypothetical protein [Planctomycetota bacterium]